MPENKQNKQLSRLLICCEGETEKEYLTALVDTLEIKARVSVRKTAACAPIALLEEAYKEYMWSNATDKTFPFTEVWCVFDRDHHPSYDATFEVAQSLSIPVHLCWTNPCIEFWFWLHYCGDKNQLKFDEFVEVGRTQERVVINSDEYEDRLVRRLKRSIKPDTMLELLKEKCPAYSKAKCPPGVIKRTPTACDNLKVLAQSEDPKCLGSAIPALLLRFANLQDEVHPTKSPAAVSILTKSSPESTNTQISTVFVPSDKNTQSSEVSTASGQTHGDTDPKLLLLEPLKICLRDWAFIHVTLSGLAYPPGALVHFDQFFTKAATVALDCKTRDRGNIGLGALKNIRKLITANESARNKDRVEKIAGRLYAIGKLLTFFARDLGISGLLEGLSFTKQKLKDVSQPETTQTQNPVPPSNGSGAVSPSAQSVGKIVVPEKVVKSDDADSEDRMLKKLKEANASLQRVQAQFGTVMSGVVAASDCVEAYEMVPGLCDKGAFLQAEVTRILNECTALVTSLPASSK